ncbi:5-oxoprolinase subunit PxpB [Candidatus Villigracilis saccharophilus]|uniref:5-oxoprolinase subunit PxpB n=1 Tax=Candidatus Villigracilis saccharophilus TaxID=3140684 RepID=UPI0031366BE2|nr:5-oxoprolinase subunit PxpB [Anaerolineales bacterium]
MFKPLGDSALLVQLGDKIDSAINQRVHALNALLQTKNIAGIIETVPAYCTLLIHYDPLILTFNQVTSWVRDNLTQVDDSLNRKPRQLEVPTRYGGASGPDLETVAVSRGISIADVIRIHSEHEYIVYMIGFTPGFPYLGTLDQRLIMPRIETPRMLVKAGTVAIAGSQTGIYPLDSPGGWHLIGWTSLILFDPTSNSPFLFAPGDIIKFIPIGEDHA